MNTRVAYISQTNDFEKLCNDTIREIEKDGGEIIDIKFTEICIDDGNYEFTSGLIIYKEGKKDGEQSNN